MSPLLDRLKAMPDSPSEPESRPDDKSPRVFRSEELLRGQKEVQIEHQGEIYRLRLTRNGRLVLYK